MVASVCSRCGSPLAPNAQFCSRCGAAIVAPTAPTYAAPTPYPTAPGAAYPSGAYPTYPPAQAPREERPTGAGVLSIIGGVFILLGGIVEAEVGSLIASITGGASGGIILLVGVVGCIIGLVIVVLGILLLTHPDNNVTYGVVVIVLSLVSLVTSVAGGFLIGFILALIGGILAITWKPSTPTYVVYQQPPYS